MPEYIYQYENWPEFTWDENRISFLLGQVRLQQGKLIGQMSALGFSEREEKHVSTVITDVVKSSEIEGERLNYDQVRSSIARHLGIESDDLIEASRDVDGVVEMMLDATQNYHLALTEERILGWHASLFPTGWSGMNKIQVGSYRTGEMQIVSGPLGKETVHYEAPKAENLLLFMDEFLVWANEKQNLDDVLKAAIAHFWFIIIHPFDDGNGRIARAISDMFLARSENSTLRFYSLSNQILTEKKAYYSILKQEQHSSGDITAWLEWFLNCLLRAIQNSEDTLERVLIKSKFWDYHKETELNKRQRLMLNKLFDGFEGKLKTTKWAKITKSSTDSALRDIKDLIEKGILKQEESGGRSTNYELVDDWRLD